MGYKTDMALAEGNWATHAASFIHDATALVKAPSDVDSWAQMGIDATKVVNDTAAVLGGLALATMTEVGTKGFAAAASARVKVVVASVMQPTAVYLRQL